MKNKNFVWPLAAMAIATALSAGTAFAISPETFDRNFKVSGPVTLDVRSDVGGITLTAGDAGTVHVHAVLLAKYGLFARPLVEANLHELEKNPPIQRVGNSIRIGYTADPGLLNGVSMHLDIQVPRDSQVRAFTRSGGLHVEGIVGPIGAHTTSGAIGITNVGGRVDAATDSGGITIHDVRGPAVGHTTSGHIEITDVNNGVHATTRSGHIVIRNIRSSVTARDGSGGIEATQVAGALDAQTGSGAIRLSQTRPAPVRAQAHSGAIQIELASAVGYAVDAKSKSGRVSVPALAVSQQHVASGNIGAGGPLVDIDTDSGKITIGLGS